MGKTDNGNSKANVFVLKGRKGYPPPRPPIEVPEEELERIRRNNPDVDVDYLLQCLAMTPEERFINCIRMTEWAAKTNKYWEEEIKRREEGCFLLKKT